MPRLILTTFLLTICAFFSCQSFVDNALENKKYTEVIKQNIGGKLICEVHYSNDFHSWQYVINYKYKDKNDSIFDLGQGRYDGVNWRKNEQLISFGKWTILPTSESHHADKLIIGDRKTNVWTEYEISPETIEQNDLWKKQKINSSLGYNDSESRIQKYNSEGQFSIVYTFARKERIPFFKTGKRTIVYTINNETGRPEITDILEFKSSRNQS